MKYPLSITTLMGIIYLSFFNTGGLNTTSLFAHFDKFAHFVMYAALCSILWYEYYKSHTETDRKRIFWGAIIAPTLFSGALEVFQGCFTEYRNGDFVDFLFNEDIPVTLLGHVTKGELRLDDESFGYIEDYIQE